MIPNLDEDRMQYLRQRIKHMEWDLTITKNVEIVQRKQQNLNRLRSELQVLIDQSEKNKEAIANAS